MSDLILICTRPSREGRRRTGDIRRAATLLAPDNAATRPAAVVESGAVIAALANPPARRALLSSHGAVGGVASGVFFGPAPDWAATGAAVPDGSYALARWDAGTLELVTDICASHTVWYVLNDGELLASTSQRALIALLGSFELEPAAAAWMLSSGTLGPDVSWDRRIRRLLPDTRFVLHRDTWRTGEHTTPCVLTSCTDDHATQIDSLREAMADTVASLDLEVDDWVLPLSGGRDSRTLLALLVACGRQPHCLTWTTHESARSPFSDAFVARLLARRYRVEHEFRYLGAAPADAHDMLEGFVAANESRNDEIAAYTDGLALWADLARRGVDRVVRGDEPFGMRARPATPENARQQTGGQMVSDFPDGHLIRRLGLAAQEWPQRLRIRAGEDRRLYRTRLSQHGYTAIIASGLNGTKARYVEIVSPLLSRRVVGAMRALSPEMRQYARAYSGVVHRQATGIPYPRSSSTPGMAQLLSAPAMVDEIVRELLDPAIERVLPGHGGRRVLAALALEPSQRPAPKARAKSLLKDTTAALPVSVLYRVKPAWKGPEPLPPALLALRAVLSSKAIRLFEADARALRRPGSDAETALSDR